MAIYYLSPSATGSANGLSTSNPWTWGQFVSATLANNDTVYALLGTYSSTAVKNITQNSVRVETYTTTPGDALGQATVTLTTNNQAAISLSGNGCLLNGFIFDINNLASNNTVICQAYSLVRRVKVMNASVTISCLNAQNGYFMDCEITNCISSGGNPICSVVGGTMKRVTFSNLTGGSGVNNYSAVQLGNGSSTITECNFFNCTGDGVSLAAGNQGNYLVEKSRFTNISRYPIQFNLTGDARGVADDCIINSVATAANPSAIAVIQSGGKIPILRNIAYTGTKSGTFDELNVINLTSTPFETSPSLSVNNTTRDLLKPLGFSTPMSQLTAVGGVIIIDD